MKKEWILNEEEKRVRNNIIEENRRKKLKNDNKSNSLSGDSNSSVISDVSEECPPNIQTNENLIDFNDSSLEVIPIVRPLTDYNNNFTEAEGNVFTELLSSTRFLTIVISGITSQIKVYLDAMKMISYKWDEEIRKLIKTAKSLKTFNKNCENDRISLLKFGAVEVAFMRSIICYDTNNQYWILSMDEYNGARLDLEVFKQNSYNDFENCKSFVNKLANIWDMDQIIIHLLMAVILFTPSRPQLINRSNIGLQQQIYMHLLKRYLLLKYRSESESESRFAKLMEVISDLHDFHEKQIRQFLMKMPPNYVFFNSPLLKELYDKNDYK